MTRKRGGGGGMQWPTIRLAALLHSLESGSRPKGGARTTTQGIPSLGGEHLDSDGGIRLENIKYVPESHFAEMTQGVIQESDILLVKDGATTGKVALVRSDFPYARAAVNEHVFILRVDQGLACPAYVFYFLLSARGQAEILRDHRGATIGGISRGFASDVRIPLPPLSEQRRIVEILDQADRLRRLRAEADAKAARILPALFIKMFGDPARLVSHSSARPLGQFAVDLQNGFACGDKDVPAGVPHLRMNNIGDAGRLDVTVVRTVPREMDKDRYRLRTGDVLFMSTNSEDKIGKTCVFAPPDDKHYLFSNHLIRIRCAGSDLIPEYVATFLHMLWRSGFFPSMAKRWVNQATVSRTALEHIRIPAFAAGQQKAFAAAYTKLDKQLVALNAAAGRLSQLVTCLLHGAFSGSLTASWREAHMKELLQEMREQAKALQVVEQ